VFSGDRIAIVGASGAGKTSLLRLLNRLSEPISGSIYLDDQPFCRWSPVQLRQQIILVLQESKLLGMTARQALEYPLLLRKLPKPEIHQRVTEWINRLQIPLDWLDRTELQLSVGQRQLVAIARALIIQPRVLLLDEPTSALDIGRSQMVLAVLRELADNGKITVLMANHQLDLAEQFCSRVLHLQNGQLIQNLPATQMNWTHLRQLLMETNSQPAEDWD
jgi:D-methionine transport system ATP-binding protein